MPGELHYGDNLEILRHKIADASVDLVYLDPPFNSDRTYGLSQRGSLEQEKAFVDTWTWDEAAERAFLELTDLQPPGVSVPPALSKMMRALRDFLGNGRLASLAYLSMMAVRLVELHRVLRATGALFLHCDPTESHYLKMVLDAIFGPERFEGEIVWQRTPAKALMTKRLPTNHDVILYYRKSDAFTWHGDKLFEPYDLDELDEKTDEKYSLRDPDGRRYQLTSLINPNADRPNLTYEFLGVTRVWRWTRERMQETYDRGLVIQPKPGGVPRFKRYLDEQRGKPIGDVWTDIPPLNSQALERTGLATQKPVPLLERIIEAASSKDDVVLDPFCGCGTTIEAAERLGRKWVGIDVAIRAIDLIKERLDEKIPGPRVWTEHGEPYGVESAAHLADTNAYDFQWWAVRKLGGSPPKGVKKKGKDGGVDGELKLRDESGVERRAVISVKGGRSLTPDMVRALKTTMDQEKADHGILLTMHKPSDGMYAVAKACGYAPWSTATNVCHRIVIVHVAEIFSKTVKLPGKVIPSGRRSVPPPPEARKGENLSLPFGPAAKKPKPGITKGEHIPPPPASAPAKKTERGRTASSPAKAKREPK